MALSTAQSALVDRTLIKLDALDAPGSSIVGSRGEVYQVLQEAARQIILDVPPRLLYPITTDGKDAANTEIDIAALSSTNYVLVPLVNDFLRLIGLRLSGWDRTLYHNDVEEHEDADDLVGFEEGDQVALTRRPKAFLVYYSTDDWTGTSALKVFPGSDEASPVEMLRYVAVTAPESLPDTLTEPLLWRAAGLLSRAVAPDVGRLCDAEYAEAIRNRIQTRKHVAVRPYRYL